ncbi:unnamed protein product [Calypogeia fissa]
MRRTKALTKSDHALAALDAVSLAVAYQDHFVSSSLMDSFPGRMCYGQRRATKLTLAQRCGLVDKPKPKLSVNQWAEVQEKSKQRQDTAEPCPICKEKFLIKEKVILSCSHIFHQKCLASFERYSQLHCCPVCRTTKYEKLSLKASPARLEHLCATRIQAAYRGHLARKAFWQKVKRPKDPEKCRKWFACRLESAASNLLLQIAENESEVDALCKEVENTIADSKKVCEEVGARIQERRDISQFASDYVTMDQPYSHGAPWTDWHNVVEKALERGDTECPICIEALHRRGACQSSLAWLSCTHIFHVDCILTFEKFHTFSEDNSNFGVKPFCPICRSSYERLIM